MRAGAFAPDASRLLGVRVAWMLALGWGFAAMLGALAGMMIAPTTFLDPNMMRASCSTRSPPRCSAGSTARSARSSAASGSGSA